ncbi:2-oxo-4-hydroxy-4-carboxy-5-ureidoimidazoline decarboxylase [Weizmannia acidilactici]|uniref:2-oxo-4-hydroxy-4-carboxy-5-ureidoimidazoline decarboxylase n=1 Tax=Weizmannia acidilactici TaxID=2607726 RepID=UPI001289131E|nr:2-oxo-4-hydroxy-4-carboxy-5-ureidoimidazoline decarboxylase [Weizmannia acidilactici]GER67600.1 hypothetical protein BpJC4_20710 [Weizmannia acidilactici]GER73686.1 hypothetical protein BpPP18_17530 [Weizmannia acidilactici]
MMLTIHELNQATQDEFVEQLGGIFEHSPWIPKKAASFRPFSSLDELHRTMVQIVENSGEDLKLALIREHPNLGERIAMSEDSVSEQKGAGLCDLTRDEYEKFKTANAQYMEKFGFPFILAVRGKNKGQIYGAMLARLDNSREEEIETALQQIYQIAYFRLEELFRTSIENERMEDHEFRSAE